mmetsp:Transcript_21476/g.50061  ORF Transcript_21476/g.50061 Transcript_21476/m.50061 type:complete len:211 (-) Transcript_21476:122-754(-)
MFSSPSWVESYFLKAFSILASLALPVSFTIMRARDSARAEPLRNQAKNSRTDTDPSPPVSSSWPRAVISCSRSRPSKVLKTLQSSLFSSFPLPSWSNLSNTSLTLVASASEVARMRALMTVLASPSSVRIQSQNSSRETKPSPPLSKCWQQVWICIPENRGTKVLKTLWSSCLSKVPPPSLSKRSKIDLILSASESRLIWMPAPASSVHS